MSSSEDESVSQATPLKAVDNSNLVSLALLNAKRLLVVNSKGGAGKTTVATNLAAWFARKAPTAIIDHDVQLSATYWQQLRPSTLPPVYVVNTGKDPVQRQTRSFQLRLPFNTQWIISDSPAGVNGPVLDQMINEHDFIVVPVLPSDIDIRASARFIGELLLTPSMRKHRKPVAVIANRVRTNTHSFERLQKFLLSLNIPFVASLRDTQHYVRCFGEGTAIADCKGSAFERDRDDWQQLLLWIDAQGGKNYGHVQPELVLAEDKGQRTTA